MRTAIRRQYSSIARKAVDTSMLASSVRIDPRVETDVRAVVSRDHRLRAIAEVLRLRRRQLEVAGVLEVGEIRLDVEPLETVRRIPRGAAAARRRDEG
jgi:hypothetical protein